MRALKLLWIIPLFIVYISCEREKLDPECDGSQPTYNSAIKEIIDAKCTNFACHGSGSSRGAFTTYAGLESVLNNGQFESRVLAIQDMPKNGSLSQEQINQIQCWVENGYPEN